jgi:O-antigen/teichoic acid export membrane protein
MSLKIQRSMADGAMWMMLFKLTERALGVVSTVVLVRLLSPGDFGIVAMAISFIAMAELLAAFGFDVALIQERDATVEHYHTAWTLNALMGLGITVLMLAAAAPVAAFYRQPEVFWVVVALSFGPLIGGLENIGVIAFRKDLQFRSEFLFQIVRKLAGFVVVIPLAAWTHSYWALVAGTLASKLAGTTMSYRMHEFRPRLSLAMTGRLFGFSKWLLVSNMLGFLRLRLSDFLIGRLHGPGVLGLYNVSAEFAYLPTTELSAPINRALLPGFARMAHDVPALSSAYENAMGFLALLAVPAAAGIYSVAPLLVPVVLGSQWSGAAPLLQVLAINGALTLLESSIYTVMVGAGHPGIMTRVGIVHVAAQIGGMLLLVGPLGARGAAYATLAASVMAAPLYLFFLRRRVGIPMRVFVRAIARPVAAAASMMLILYLALPRDVAALSALAAGAWLAAGVLAGAASYAAALALFWLAMGRPDGTERLAIARLRHELRERLGIGARETEP